MFKSTLRTSPVARPASFGRRGVQEDSFAVAPDDIWRGVAALHKLSPLGRSSTPADVAATVKFALENSSITGTTLLVDGGQHLMKFDRDFSLM